MTCYPISRVWVLLLLTLLAGCLASGYRPRPLLLNPQLRPASYVPEEKFDAIEIVSFANEAAGIDPNDPRIRIDVLFSWEKFQFLNDPRIVFNDALFSALSNAEAFQSVSLRSVPGGGRYRLSGRILTMDAKEEETSFFCLSCSTTVAADFAAHFRLEDTFTGALLLDEKISGSGVGQGRETPGSTDGAYDTSTTVAYDTSTTVAYDTSTTVDYSYGIEQALSDAITRMISAGTDRIIDAIAIQSESGMQE